MDDMISRQSAIDAVEFGITYAKAINKETGEVKNLFEESNAELKEAVGRIKQLPSAQPEIIYCKDCKHFIREDIEEYTVYGFYNTYFHAFCDRHWDREQGEYIDVKLDDFCSFADMREETT